MVYSIQRLSTVLDNHSDRLQSLEKRIDELHSDSLVDHLQFKKSTKQIIDDLTKENDLLKSEFKSMMTNKEIEILKYCQPHVDKMWAAVISGIILDMEFRNVTKSIIQDKINVTEKEQDVHELSCLIYICTCDKKVVKK